MFCDDNYPRYTSPENSTSYQMKEPWAPSSYERVSEVASVHFKIHGLSLTRWHQHRHSYLKSCKQGNNRPGRDRITATFRS
jgi:hypothetical protein